MRCTPHSPYLHSTGKIAMVITHVMYTSLPLSARNRENNHGYNSCDVPLTPLIHTIQEK